MAVEVNKELCIGCGTCVSLCPAVFEMDEDGKSKVKAQSCKDCNLKEVADSCPVSAIKIS